MNDTREILGVWTYDPASPYTHRNRQQKQEREDFINAHFGGADKTPAYIWRIEFFRVPADLDYYGMTLHRYAAHPEGGRYHTWAKAYDEHGMAVSTRLAAVVEPENYPLPALPPEYLLLGNPKDKS
jgi:hypothetical protein